MMRSTAARVLLALSTCLTLLPIASAQGFPGGHIKMVVPFLPGGGTDVLSRLVSKTMSEQKGWTFVMDNKPGAGGNLRLDLLAKAKPDGLTFGMGQTSNLAINPNLVKKMPYDAVTDFAHVALVASQPMVLVVSDRSPYRQLADLVAAAKAKPGQLKLDAFIKSEHARWAQAVRQSGATAD